MKKNKKADIDQQDKKTFAELKKEYDEAKERRSAKLALGILIIQVINFILILLNLLLKLL